MSNSPAIRCPQDADGITPRTILAQTIQIHTRADWYAFSRACRTVARARVEERRAGLHGFWLNVAGRVYRLKCERDSFRVVQTSTGMRRVCSGQPIRMELAMISARPTGQRVADELAWAARYRANAMRDVREGCSKAASIRAARACLRDARALLACPTAHVFNA